VLLKARALQEENCAFFDFHSADSSSHSAPEQRRNHFECRGFLSRRAPDEKMNKLKCVRGAAFSIYGLVDQRLEKNHAFLRKSEYFHVSQKHNHLKSVTHAQYANRTLIKSARAHTAVPGFSVMWLTVFSSTQGKSTNGNLKIIANVCWVDCACAAL
jgi:hypothetical protein